MIKTCGDCCFHHKCRDDAACEFYCSTLSICDIDDEEYIEEQRDVFRLEWMTYAEAFYD